MEQMLERLHELEDQLSSAQDEARREAELRAAAEAEVLRQRGLTIFARLQGMSGSASESSSISTDVSRRGVPASKEESVEDFFRRPASRAC